MLRDQAVQNARKSIELLSRPSSGVICENDDGSDPPLWGVILGTLGRQGSFKQLQVYSNRSSIPPQFH